MINDFIVEQVSSSCAEDTGRGLPLPTFLASPQRSSVTGLGIPNSRRASFRQAASRDQGLSHRPLHRAEGQAGPRVNGLGTSYIDKLSTACVVSSSSSCGAFNAAIPTLRAAMAAADTHVIVDLCSGGGGPWRALAPALAERGPVRVVLR